MPPEENRHLKVIPDHLCPEGPLMNDTCSAAISTVTGEAETDRLVAAMESGFRKLAATA